MASYGFVIILVVMFAVFYFLVIRPQKKRQGEHQRLVEALQKGDKVITIGGLMGEIDNVGEHDVILRVEDGSRLKFLKTSIMGKQPAGDIPEADESWKTG